MSDFGFWELALIMLIALLIVGPERLPKLLATVGHWIGRIRRLTMQLKTEFAEEAGTDDVKNIISDARNTVDRAGRDIQREFVNTDPLVKAIEKQIDKGRFTDEFQAENRRALDEDKGAKWAADKSSATKEKAKQSEFRYEVEHSRRDDEREANEIDRMPPRSNDPDQASNLGNVKRWERGEKLKSPKPRVPQDEDKDPNLDVEQRRRHDG